MEANPSPFDGEINPSGRANTAPGSQSRIDGQGRRNPGAVHSGRHWQVFPGQRDGADNTSFRQDVAAQSPDATGRTLAERRRVARGRFHGQLALLSMHRRADC